MNVKNNKNSAMIFAAGLGTRLYPLTANKPKALVEYQGKVLLDGAIQKMIGHGIQHIVVNAHHFAEQIIDFVAQHQYDAEIVISHEKDELLDTAGGFKCAEKEFQSSENIVLYNVDVVSNIDINALIDYHVKNEAIATLAVKNRETARYFLFNNKNLDLVGWENKKTGEVKEIKPCDNRVSLAFSGIQVLNPRFLSFIPENQKVSMTPIYLEVAQSEKVAGFIHQNDEWIDVGKIELFK